MTYDSKYSRLKVYVSSTDKFKHTPLYEMIVYAAKRYGLLGATVQKGIMGFGSSSTIHSSKLWELSEKLPLTVEIMDETEKLLNFVDSIKPWMEKLRYGAVVTIEPINVLLLKTGRK